MALATKCPHCNTIFRVAADQLKLRGGIVRCGACNEVFDGNAALLEPAARPTPVIPEVVIAPAASAAYIHGAPVDFDLDELGDGDMPPESASSVDMHETPAGPQPGALPAPPDEAQFDAPSELDSDAPPAPPAETQSEALPAAPSEAPPAEPLAEPASELPADEHAAFDIASEAAEPFPLQAHDEAPLPAEPAPDVEPDAPAPADEPEPAPVDAPPPAVWRTGPASAPAADEIVAEQDSEPSAPSADSVDAHGRVEPNFDTPQEHIVAVALDDLHHFDDLESEPPTPQELHSAALEELHHLGEDAAEPAPEDLEERDEPGARDEPDERDETALHPIAAVNTGVPDDGASITEEPVSRLGSDPKAEMAARMRAIAGITDEEDGEETLDHGELGFVKRANRSEKYGRSAKLAMLIGIPLMLIALLLQAATTFRNTLAADYPSLKPALAATCDILGCRIELPSQLDALSIEQGELQTVAENTFNFTTTLRNQSRSAQAWPHIELILDDSAGKPVLRRVFAPRDYLANKADTAKGFSPRSEQTVKLYFELSQLKASGYHIAIFYP